MSYTYAHTIPQIIPHARPLAPPTHTHTQTDTGKLGLIQIHIHAPWPGRKLGILYHKQEEHSLQVIHVRSALILFWWIAQIRRTRTLCEWMCVCSLINIPLKTNQNKPEASEVRLLLSCWSVSRRCTYLLLGVVECVGGWLFSRVFVPGFCTVSHYVM